MQTKHQNFVFHLNYMICNWIYLPFTFASFVRFSSLVACESVGCNDCSFFASINGECSNKSTKYIFDKICFCTKEKNMSANYVLRYLHKLMLAAKLFFRLSTLIINFSCSSLSYSRLQRAQVYAISCMLVTLNAWKRICLILIFFFHESYASLIWKCTTTCLSYTIGLQL